MTARIPHKIKINVLKMWLEGISRNKILSILCISKGSVSGIIQNVRLTMNAIDLSRAVAKALSQEEVDIYTFAAAINLKRKMDESELSPELMEKFHEDLDTLSFKTGINPKILIERLVSILVLVIKLNLPTYQANNWVDVINKRIGSREKINR